MTTLAVPMVAVPRAQPTGQRGLSLPAWTTAAATVLVLLARLPFLGHAPSPDEAGFLLVGKQWNGQGTSLYGNYFVDRPPLLVSIFKLAADVGGLPALRLFGCLAVLLIVVGCGQAGRLIAGEQAGRWAALTAAALCLSPLLGGYAVNGELLAAPFVVGGIIVVVRALQARDSMEAMRWGALAGVCAICAVMVKQNFADVAVFGAVAFVLSALRGEIMWRRLVWLSAAAVAGALVALALLSVWTVGHGTSLHGVYDAMYPFRVLAGHVMASGGRAHASARLAGLVGVAVMSMVVPLAVLAVIAAVRRRRRSPLSWALLALLGFAAASVLMGGNFWHHYLVGLIVPISLVTGVLAADRRFLVRPAVALAVASAALAWVGSLAVPQGSDSASAGSAVASAARPTDTIVNLYGHADVVGSAGLSSPYEHLWSLPAKTLDPHLAELDAVLSGPDAPTWLVTGRTVRSWGLQTARTKAIIQRDYRRVETVCEHTIYLRDGASRPRPQPTTTCRGASPVTTLKELRS